MDAVFFQPLSLLGIAFYIRLAGHCGEPLLHNRLPAKCHDKCKNRNANSENHAWGDSEGGDHDKNGNNG